MSVNKRPEIRPQLRQYFPVFAVVDTLPVLDSVYIVKELIGACIGQQRV